MTESQCPRCGSARIRDENRHAETYGCIWLGFGVWIGMALGFIVAMFIGAWAFFIGFALPFVTGIFWLVGSRGPEEFGCKLCGFVWNPEFPPDGALR